MRGVAEAADIEPLAPDLVVCASGGVPDMGLAEAGGELVASVWDVLGGEVRAEGAVLICDEVGGHAALSLADRLAAEGMAVTFVTTDREPGRAMGGQNYPVYLRNLYRSGTRFVCDHALLGVRREGNRRVARLRNAYSREVLEIAADSVVLDKGTLPVSEVFDALVDDSRNLGELDHEALVTLRSQPLDANPGGRYALFRVGDALAGRDLHAALLDANRLCRVI